MTFNIQKFAKSGGSPITSDGGWYHCQNQTTFFNIPEGTEFNEDDSGMGAGCIHESDPGDDVTATFAIEGVSNATGDSQTVTVTLSGELSAVTVYDSGSFISDIITVTGGNKANLTVVIGGTKYNANASGKLEIALPDFGLMTKADKMKLDGINSSTYLTTAAASETYLTQAAAGNTYVTKSAAITSGEMTANGFVLKNALGNGVVTIPAQQ